MTVDAAAGKRDRELCDAWLSPDRGGLETVSAEFVADSLAKRLIRVDEARLKYESDLDLAWGVIANVSGGDWTKQSPEWQQAAARFRDRYSTPTMHDAPAADPFAGEREELLVEIQVLRRKLAEVQAELQNSRGRR